MSHTYGQLMTRDGIDTTVPPTSDGCAECDASGGWWVHLRRCAQCGHVGCCDSSPGQHATGHFKESGHPVMQSFEPGEDWFFDFTTEESLAGPELAEPREHSAGVAAPGPADRLPPDWQDRIH